MKPIYFGVGCFHFQEISDKHDKDTYIAQLTSLLNSCSNINNISLSDLRGRKIKPPIVLYHNNFIENEDYELLNGLNNINPHPIFFSIKFDLFIPQRVQKEFPYGKVSKTCTENFKVHILYDIYFPVVLVELVEQARDADHRTELWLSRNFYKRNLRGNLI